MTVLATGPGSVLAGADPAAASVPVCAASSDTNPRRPTPRETAQLHRDRVESRTICGLSPALDRQQNRYASECVSGRAAHRGVATLSPSTRGARPATGPNGARRRLARRLLVAFFQPAAPALRKHRPT